MFSKNLKNLFFNNLKIKKNIIYLKWKTFILINLLTNLIDFNLNLNTFNLLKANKNAKKKKETIKVRSKTRKRIQKNWYRLDERR